MQGLRRLGTVLHATRNGYIVATIEEPERLPPLGVPVYDEDRKQIGQLLDIIGPVKQPYAVVKPATRELLKTVKPGQILYYQPPRPRRRRKKVPKPVKPGRRQQRRRGERGGGRGGGRRARGREKSR